MKEAKVYRGRKILVKIDAGDANINFKEERNIITSLESFKNDINNEMYTSIELLQDNLTLYKCDLRKSDKLENICKIRDYWKKGQFAYRDFLTKNEIIEKLNNDYLVAVEGLQEIDIKDVDKLD